MAPKKVSVSVPASLLGEEPQTQSPESSESLDYESLKQAILNKFEISIESYRLWFRTAEWKDGESALELQARLKDLCTRWLKPQQHDKEMIIDFIILEQFL
uniref:SCAN box domain-containing protein n=1 Tax=Erpetoichthys calabaricus TaxID=27687 RepID=A0A8C4SPX7_ERPCA